MSFENRVVCANGQREVAPCGLVVKTDLAAVGVPLVSVTATVHIINVAGQVILQQEYVNNSTENIQAVYLFPTEDRVAVHYFRATVDERVIEGIVKDKDTAREEFVEAVTANKTAFLLEEVRPDILELCIGNMRPGSHCTITIKYVQDLDVQEFKPRFTLPTTIAPRYIPESDPQIAQANYQFECLPKVPLSITVNTLMRSKIKEITCPTHKIHSNMEDTPHDDGFYHACTELKGESTLMDKDLVLVIDSDDPLQHVIVFDQSPDEASVAVMMSFVPHFTLGEDVSEFVFLIDCSGSMSGQAISKAVEALKVFIQSLPEDCYFNIYRFGSSFQSLYKTSQRYSDKTLKEAKVYASATCANLGGTEILAPIRAILSTEPIRRDELTYEKRVFVLTDGQVSNTSAVQEHIKNKKRNGRVFSLGIGASASRELVKGIARAGEGTALFCAEQEPMHNKVISLLKDATAKCASVRQIECAMAGGETVVLDDSSNLTLYSPSLPTIMYSKHKVTFHMLLPALPDSITYTCQSPGVGNVAVSYERDTFCRVTADAVRKLVAAKIIRNCGDNISVGADDNVIMIMKEMALANSIVTPYTSFICVDKSTEAVSESTMYDAAARDARKQKEAYGESFMSLSSTHYTPTVFDSYDCSRPLCLSSAPPSRKKAGMTLPSFNVASRIGKLFSSKPKSYTSPSVGNAAPCAQAKRRISPDMAEDLCVGYEDDSEDDSEDEESLSLTENRGSQTNDNLIALLDLSNTKGTFTDLAKLCAVTRQSNAEVEKLMKTVGGVSRDAFLTVLAIQYLYIYHPDKADTWNMLEQKSVKWLKKEVGDMDVLKQAHEKVEAFWKSCQ